jgi:chromosome segregation ATPase
MRRGLGFVALGLGGIGLLGCLAGLIAIWVVRPSVLRSSAEILDAADGVLKVVEEKATRADELVRGIGGTVDSVARRIHKLGEKADRTPEEEKALKRIEEDLVERFRQVDAIAEAAETAVTLLSKASRLTTSLRMPGSRPAASSAPEEAVRDRTEALSRVAKKLGDLRAKLARLREDKESHKAIVERLVRVTREVSDDLKAVDSGLQEVRQKGAEWRTEIAELRITIPAWTNWAAILGSVLAVWMGLGQFMLACATDGMSRHSERGKR